jgi:hypothetical protein
MALIRQDYKIISNYYSKTDSSNKIRNFKSKHPFNMKFNTALAYAKRIKSLSHQQFYFSNFQMIMNDLPTNGYPEKVINKVIKKYKYFRRNEPRPMKKFCGLPYIPAISDKIAKKLTEVNESLNFGFKLYKKVYNVYPKTKSKLKDEGKAGVIYQLNCIGDQVLGQSCNKVYIGESKRKMSVRIIREHKRDDINKAKLGNKTALIQHSNDAKHIVDFGRPLILNSENNWYKRRFLESSYIQFNKPNLVNFKQDRYQ